MIGDMGQSRTKNSVRNIIYSFASYFIILLFQFINRTVFIRLLTSEYLGLNGLFSNVLSFLSLAELGVGSAINYALYRPIEQNDTERIKSIMGLYRKLYCIIGSIVLVVGGVLAPFLPLLIKDMPQDMPYIRLYYLLYVLNSGVSYFFTFKRSLIICNQKEYISSVTTTVSKVILSVLQVVVLLVSHSYIEYLVVAILVTAGENITVSILADRMYPYLKDTSVQALPGNISAEIKKNVFAMMFHKIGTVIVFSTDNIIISRFVGIISVGLYSNYTLITSAVSNMAKKVFTAMTASVGNLTLSDDKKHVEEVFYRVLFINFWTQGFSAIALFCLLQPFIRLWLGSRYLLSTETVAIIAVNFYLGGMRLTVTTFKDASGNFWYDRYKPLIESTLNIVLSIPLAIRCGVSGVLLGTIGSTLFVPFWFEAYVLFKYYFDKGIKEYLLKQIFYGWIVFMSGWGCSFLCGMIPYSGIVGLICGILVCAIIPNSFFVLVFYRSQEYQYFTGLVKKYTDYLRK